MRYVDIVPTAGSLILFDPPDSLDSTRRVDADVKKTLFGLPGRTDASATVL